MQETGKEEKSRVYLTEETEDFITAHKKHQQTYKALEPSLMWQEMFLARKHQTEDYLLDYGTARLIVYRIL